MTEPKAKQYRLLTVAYGVLVILVVAGFVRSEMAANEIDLEQQRRSFLLCELTNDNQDNLVSVLDRMYSEELEAPGIDDETRAAREEFMEEVRETLSPTQCPPDPDGVSEEDKVDDVEEDER